MIIIGGLAVLCALASVGLIACAIALRRRKWFAIGLVLCAVLFAVPLYVVTNMYSWAGTERAPGMVGTYALVRCSRGALSTPFANSHLVLNADMSCAWTLAEQGGTFANGAWEYVVDEDRDWLEVTINGRLIQLYLNGTTTITSNSLPNGAGCIEGVFERVD